MKLVSIENTTLLKFVVPTRSAGQIYMPALVQAVGDEYSFVKLPDIEAERIESLEFLHGRWNDIGIAKLGFYSDGIVIHSQSMSKVLDGFFAAMQEWAKDKFDVDFVPTKSNSSMHESALVVQSSGGLLKVLKKLSKIETSIAKRFATASGMAAECVSSGFMISANSNEVDGFRPSPFKVELRAGADPELRYFFSTAPLPTHEHLAVLEELESIV